MATDDEDFSAMFAASEQNKPRARRPAARYVAPFSTNFVILFARLFPTRVWDWAMRKVGFLNAKSLGIVGPAPAVPAPIDMTMPAAKPAEVRASN